MKKKKEKVTEIFEVEKKGKTKEVKKTGTEEIPVENKGQEQSENKILKNILVIVGIIFLLIVGFYFWSNSHQTLDYNGVKFSAIKTGSMIFYQTQIPYVQNGTTVPYNFYLRTSPKDLEKIPFNTTGFNLMKVMDVNVSNEFSCNGDATISLANLAQLNSAIGAQFVMDPNATCDPQGRYMFFNVVNSTKTQIVKDSNNCYTVEVSNCQILPAMEKIMAEMFVKINQY